MTSPPECSYGPPSGAEQVKLEELRFDQRGLIPVVVQDQDTGQIRMLAWANREALERTLATGKGWFYSRSRQELWQKGATSGNELLVHDVAVDCDADALVYTVHPKGPSCHTGHDSCFYRRLQGAAELAAGEGAQSTGQAAAAGDLEETTRAVFQVIEDRFAHRPTGSYVAELASQGPLAISSKVMEEAYEVSWAYAHPDAPDSLAHELADLWFHLLVLAADAGLTPGDIAAELQSRR